MSLSPATARPTQWNNLQVAKFTYRDTRSHTTVADFASPRARWTKGSLAILQGGASFADAVKAAQRLQKNDPLNHALGILKDAQTGVHWLAPLGGERVYKHSIDGYMQTKGQPYGNGRYQFKAVERLTEDLQAIVGASTVIDLRGTKVASFS